MVIKDLQIGESCTVYRSGPINYSLTLRRVNIFTNNYIFQGECLQRNFHHISYGCFVVNELRRKVVRQVVDDTVENSPDPTYARIVRTMFS